MNDPKEVYVFFVKEIDDVLSLAATLKIDPTYILHQHVIGLYGSIIELSSSIKVIYESGHYSAIPVLLRTILEAFVDLRNLCQDPIYGNSLTINSNKESLKFLKAAKDDKNVYAKMLESDPKINQHISNFEKESEILKSEGYKGLSIKDKFENAGMLDEYTTIYNMLCAATHNDIRALKQRHLVINKGTFSLEIFKKEDTETTYEVLGMASEILLRATYEIHALLKSVKDKELQSLRDSLNEIRGDA